MPNLTDEDRSLQALSRWLFIGQLAASTAAADAVRRLTRQVIYRYVR
jgi:hypothetical protein